MLKHSLTHTRTHLRVPVSSYHWRESWLTGQHHSPVTTTQSFRVLDSRLGNSGRFWGWNLGRDLTGYDDIESALHNSYVLQENSCPQSSCNSGRSSLGRTWGLASLLGRRTLLALPRFRRKETREVAEGGELKDLGAGKQNKYSACCCWRESASEKQLGGESCHSNGGKAEGGALPLLSYAACFPTLPKLAVPGAMSALDGLSLQTRGGKELHIFSGFFLKDSKDY